MFDGTVVKRLLKETGRATADLSEALYGNRKRSIYGLLAENSNPTANTLMVLSKFFGVPMDYFFTNDEEDVELNEKTPVTVYLRTIIDTQKRTIKELEGRIADKEKIIELREAELAIYKEKKRGLISQRF